MHQTEPMPSDLALNVHLGATKWSEIKSGWPIILGCVLGITCGIISIPGAALLIFMKGFEHDFGWSRTQVSFAHTIVITVLMLTAPVVGVICDRDGSRSAALFSQVAIGCSFLALSHIGGNITTFLILFGIMALLGAGASTVSFARIISANFVHARGLALGLAMTGTGLSNFILPLFLVPFVAIHGWRSGFIVLGIFTLMAAPVVFLLLYKAHHAPPAIAALRNAAPGGATIADAIAAPPFWILAVTFTLIALGIGGMSVHFVAMLTDEGLSPARTGAITSMLGGSMIVVRVLTGWLIDRYRATTVTAVMLVLAALCLLAFATFGAQFAMAGAIAFGLAYGSELDIVGFLTARLFGMRAYGRIYGLLYAAILLGSALSPLVYGAIFQSFGSYTHALQGAALVLICAAMLLLQLPRFSATQIQAME